MLIYASHDKLFGARGFADAVDNYHILPRVMVNSFAIMLPWIEFVTGVCLILGAAAVSASLLASVLFTVFLVAIISALMRGLNIDCGCFTLGDKAEKVALATLPPRILLLVASILAAFASLQIDWPSSWILRRKA